MFTRTAAALVVSAALTASVAFSQTAPNPTQQAIAPADGPVPTFRITVVGRTTPAINYRPRRGDTKIDFSGTPLMLQAHGDATVSGEQGYIQINAHFKKLTPASRFGASTSPTSSGPSHPRDARPISARFRWMTRMRT